jgi:hypothetical protein
MRRARVLEQAVQSVSLSALRQNRNLLLGQSQLFAVRELINDNNTENISIERYA